MAATNLGFDPFFTSATLSEMGGHELGATVWDYKGRAWTLIQADGAVALGSVVHIRSDFDCDEVSTTTAGDSVEDAGEGCPLGVAQVLIADNAYGWVCRFGQGSDIKVLAATGCESGKVLATTATPGTVDDAVTGGPVLIHGLQTAADGAGAVLAKINWPFTGETSA